MSEGEFDFKSLDLSKEIDQKKFDEEFGKLSEEDRNNLVNAAEDEARMIEAGRQRLINCLSRGDINDTIQIKDQFHLPEEIVLEAAKQGFINRLSGGYINSAIQIKDQFHLPEEIVLEAAKQELISRLSGGYIEGAIQIKDQFHLPEEILSSSEILEVANQEFINHLSNGSIQSAIQIKDQFHLPEEISPSSEILEATKQKFISRLSDGYIDDAIQIKDQFHLPEEIVLEAANQEFINHLSNGSIQSAIQIKDQFHLPEEIVLEAVKRGLIKNLDYGDFDSAFEIKLSFFFPDEHFFQIIKDQIISRLVDGYPDSIIKIKNIFALTDQFINQIIKDGFFESLIENNEDKIKSVIKTVRIFSFASPQEIIDRLPDIQDLLYRLQEFAPHLSQQAERSLDVLFALFEYRDKPDRLLNNIQENQFLADALEQNPRFGSKLLLKYQEFDKSSKQNIQTLYDAKKEILSQNPNLDPESLEFRQLMQDKLKDYKNNPEILEAIKESGVNIDEWLNYVETRYFNLESDNSHLVFSEVIQTPINRIKETINSYAHTLKKTLKEYKPELSEFKIPLEDSKETEEKIVKMQEELEKAKAEGNEKKAQGIEKGIEGLKKKIENIKTAALWDKLLGDISAFQQLKNDVFSAQEKLTQAEKDMQEKLGDKMPSGKMIQELKEKINKAKEELRSKFNILERRIEDFKTNLPELIAPCLGQERSEALIQEIKQRLAEQFDHWNTDRSTLANFFSERGDKEKGKLESQPMSIFVWARNPDIDLYQGNYSPCCICIDSAHMGSESTIADYNTDLGVQIVNIWDETKNEPVTAAWCWIGKSENEEAVLVVDNIESDTMYSANYSEQLTKELFEYLQNYAKSIGVKKVVLGKANNDLPTSGKLAKMKDDENKYDKLGGYNRDDGYFLEAEDKSVKLLWEKSAPVEIKEKKDKKIKPIEFKNFSIKSLTEKDFAKIKQLERKIYAGTDLISGQAMIEDIKSGNGLEYSIVVSGEKDGKSNEEIIGYIAATEGETDEGDASVYLEDIAVVPEAQGRGMGWEMLKGFIEKLKEKSQKENKPILLDMHLRENSQRFMERHHDDLEQMGVKLIEEALVADYYNEGEDALYQVYQISED